ncbi:MAG TPA: aldose epimerase family protein [Verrucomicrobiae bacterium]|nr:aldose epimerase family protein [Verrucomicrobiae bacterium]
MRSRSPWFSAPTFWAPTRTDARDCRRLRAGVIAGVLSCAAAMIMAGCATSHTGPIEVSRKPFGQTADGKQVYEFTLRNTKGSEARILNYGGIVRSLRVPDAKGNLGDVVLGYDTLADYLKETPYFGALIGRYGNRIARGKFTLDGQEYTLATNNYPNALHGGVKGFDKVVWEPAILTGPDGPSLKLTYLSKDGEEGYPGNLSVTVIYTLTEDNGLKIEYTATTDKDTVINLTQHSYFNLAGKGTILDHIVMIPADKFTPVDSTLIPTGELKPVDGTPFDFRTPTAIGARINQDDEQLKFGKGYDHNWVINKPMGEFGLMARVTEPTTGRVLEVLSAEPGLQFYTGNFLDGTLKGKGGQVYQFRSGFCMESQHFPDSPNKPQFPSVVLKPGQTYHSTIVFKFSTRS